MNCSRYDKIYPGIVGFVVLLYIVFFIYTIFKEHWKNYVDISNIVKIKTFSDEGGLETNLSPGDLKHILSGHLKKKRKNLSKRYIVYILNCL